MLSMRPVASGRLRWPLLPSTFRTQRRWARVHDVRFVATQGQFNPVLEKYRAKLDQKAKEEGLSSVSELREAYKDKIRSLRHESAIAQTRPVVPAPPPPPVAPHADLKISKSPSTSPPGLKTLSAFLDLTKVIDLPPQEIEYIWRLRHASSPNSLCAVIPSETYTLLSSTARRHPQFILPLPREGNDQPAEMHFLQWTFPSPTTSTVLFTHLAEYKLRGEYSQPHTTVTHHLDLKDSKGLVFLHGTVVSGRGVSVEEGKWLLMCLQKFYTAGNDKHMSSVARRRLLEKFSTGAEDFRVEELLEEAEKIV